MSRPDDALELLLPDADAHAIRRARDVTRFLRLLTDDARGATGGAVGVDIERARSELERADRSDLECALGDLLGHYLAAACDADSFAWFGEPVLDVRSAWRVLGEFEPEHDWLSAVPGPGESAAALCDRLLSNLERVGASPLGMALWRARATAVFEGPRAGERAFRELAGSPAVQQAGASRQRALASGIAECLLERGAVREARTHLTEHLARHASDARSRQLLAWARLLLGDASGARAVLVGLRPWAGPLPASLVALRALRPEWLPCLAGRAQPERTASREVHARERGEVGAAVLSVFAFEPTHGARLVHQDAAPALRTRARQWAEACADAHEIAGSPEGRVIAEARTVIEHAGAEGCSRHAVAASSRARALVPILDDEAEVAGWLSLEFEHHLVPGPARLAGLARAWRTAVLLARRHAAAPSADPDFEAVAAPPSPPPGTDVRGAAEGFEQLMAELGIKLLQRRWSGFTCEEGTPRLVADGGEGVGIEPARTGRARALARAVATRSAIRFDEPDERLSLCAGAASGCVVPLVLAGRAVGFLAVESSRRRDFKPRDVEALAQAASRHALALRLAEFGAWHRARFHFEPWFDAARADFRTFAEHALAAARSRAAVVLSGPTGTGKLVLARWLHFESEAALGPLKVHSAGLEGEARVPLPDLVGSAAGGTLVLDDVDELSPACQEELLRLLERVERAVDRGAGAPVQARIVATTRVGLAAAREAGRLRADLSARLDRLTLCVPPLCERREEIPALVQAMVRRFAREERLEPPVLDDEALALLWRQPWPDNLRGLENLVYKLALLCPGEPVGPTVVLRLARSFGLELARKLPSRHPDPRDLLAALRTTRTNGGRVNKTRAALYLGWDPDTLVARMQAAGITDDAVCAEGAWQSAREDAAREELVRGEDPAPGANETHVAEA